MLAYLSCCLRWISRGQRAGSQHAVDVPLQRLDQAAGHLRRAVSARAVRRRCSMPLQQTMASQWLQPYPWHIDHVNICTDDRSAVAAHAPSSNLQGSVDGGPQLVRGDDLGESG